MTEATPVSAQKVELMADRIIKQIDIAAGELALVKSEALTLRLAARSAIKKAKEVSGD